MKALRGRNLNEQKMFVLGIILTILLVGLVTFDFQVPLTNALPTPPEMEWCRLYGGQGDFNYLSGVIETSNMGYLFVRVKLD